MLVNQPFAAQPMPWSASLDELPTEAIQTKQMYRSVSWHRIFFTGNSDINKIASFCNAFKNVYNARGRALHKGDESGNLVNGDCDLRPKLRRKLFVLLIVSVLRLPLDRCLGGSFGVFVG